MLKYSNKISTIALAVTEKIRQVYIRCFLLFFDRIDIVLYLVKTQKQNINKDVIV